MSGENIFTAKLRAETAARQAVEALRPTSLGDVAESLRPGLANAEVEEAQRIRGLHEAKTRRDEAHEGTPPGVVWGSAAAGLCGDFVDFAAERDYPEPLTIQHAGWSMRGYGVGVYVMNHAAAAVGSQHLGALGPSGPWRSAYSSQEQLEELTNTPLAYNVFLFEDGRLRTYTQGSIVVENLAQPWGASSVAYPGLGPMGRRGQSREPYVVADLPINEAGQPLVPVIGRFVTGCEPDRYEDAPAVSEDSGPRLISSAHKYVEIKEQNLEALLTDYALRPNPAYHYRDRGYLQ